MRRNEDIYSSGLRSLGIPLMVGSCLRRVWSHSKTAALVAVLFLLLTGGAVWSQTTATIGSGTTMNNHFPWYGWYYHSYTQQMFTSIELEDIGLISGGTITSIAFNYHWDTYTIRPVEVYIGETNENNLASSWVSVNDLTLVYNNSGATFSSDWNPTITFSTSYTYHGGNLVIAVLMNSQYGNTTGDNFTQYNSTSRFYVHSATSMSRAYYSDSYAISINGEGKPVANNSVQNGSPSNDRNNVRFTFTSPTITCPRPTDLEVSSITTTSATISWTPGGTETNWVVEYSTNSDFSGATPVNVSSTPSTTLSGLSANTTYYIRVKAVCSGNDESGWRTISIYTGYCNPAPTSRDNNGITDVSFKIGGSIIHDNSTTHPTSQPFYGDYSAQIIDVAAGDAVDVVITYATSYTYMTYVWVDLNSNLTFASDEILASGESSNANPTTLTLTITIPSDLPAGNYRLRIGGADSGMNSEGNPCYTGSYAVFEDYTLHVSPSCTPHDLEYANSTPGPVTYNSNSNTYTNTLTNPHTLAVTYTSSDNDIAEPDANGEVTIKKKGTVTITATFVGDATYCPGSAEYTLTIDCPDITPPTVHDSSRCGAGTVTLGATPGTGTGVSPSTCHWYTVPSGGAATYTGIAITTPSISATTTYYVATYDATSGCESSTRTPVTATIYNSTISYTGLSNPYAEGAPVNITLTSDYTNYTWTSNYGGSGSTPTVTGTAYPGLEFHATASEHGCDASVDIKVTVIQSSGGQACGVIYCTHNGGNGALGTSTEPASLTRALTLATGGTASSPVVIRMANGTYNISAPVNLISNVIIDGGWTANTGSGVWTKTPGTSTTTINRTASSPEGGTSSPRITAIEGSNKSNFILQDLTIKTANAPNTSETYGISTYGVHLNGCSGYKFVRCKIQPGNASNGKKGGDGSSGNNGGGGEGGAGGAGGSGGSSASAGSQGSQGSAVNGVVGGAGGSGGNGRTFTWCTSGTAYTGSVGNSGNTGATGATGTAGALSNTANYGAYFTPTQGGTGGRGSNGSGGGGGGGGGGVGARCADIWNSANGGKGGKGGAGGQGGYGGSGGYGGGSSFGVYHYGSTSLGTFTDCQIVSGTRGTGGEGGAGGTGGDGVDGSSGNSGGSVTYALGFQTSYGGTGGKGGTGGTGGTGGVGGRGADGVSYKIAVVGTSGLTSSVTTGYTTDLSDNRVTSIDYGESSKAGCTNSQIFVTKTGNGTYLDSRAHYVNDKTDESSNSPSGNNATIYFTTTGLDYKALMQSTQYNPYIFITQERSLGAINGTGNICYGSNTPVIFTYGGEIKDGNYLLWRLLSADGQSSYHYLAVPADSDGDADGTAFEVNPSVLPDAGTYLIKLEIINECCGLSIPIWKKITVSRLEAEIEFDD